MRVIFFGTPKFAADILRYIADKVVAVVTQKGPISERYKKHFLCVEKIAKDLIPHVPVFFPEDLSEAAFVEKLKGYEPDLFIVAAYGKILTQELLDLPKMDAINVHASLLPKYRGAAPMPRTLMMGERKTGVTIMKMVLEIDSGDIIRQKGVEIAPDIDFGQLQDLLATLAGPLVLQVIEDYEKGVVKSFPQDESKATFAPKIKHEECEIDWEKPAEVLHNLIRALSPHPKAFCYVKIGEEIKRLNVLKADVVEKTGVPGEVLAFNGYLIVACQDKALELFVVQLEGKKEVSASEFMRGLKSSLSFIKNR